MGAFKHNIWSGLNEPEFISPINLDLLCIWDHTQANSGADQTTGPEVWSRSGLCITQEKRPVLCVILGLLANVI